MREAHLVRLAPCPAQHVAIDAADALHGASERLLQQFVAVALAAGSGVGIPVRVIVLKQ